MMLLHLWQTSTTKLRLGNHWKVRANKKHRQKDCGEHGHLCREHCPTNLLHNSDNQTQEVSSCTKKTEGITKNSFAHKHQPTLKKKTAQEIWETHFMPHP